eukprot:m.43262 g.43262  ORF g.43262 m.43262 type:complete len:506 (+) comp9960_c0_seq1:157-1674(+)
MTSFKNMREILYLLLLATNVIIPHALYHHGGSVDSLQPSDDFTVTVNGQNVFVYKVTIDGPSNGSMVHVLIPHDGVQTEVVVQVLNSSTRFPTPKNAWLRPRHGPAVDNLGNGKFAFNVSSQGHFVLEIDGEYEWKQLQHALMVLVSIVDKQVPDKTSSSVVYFGPGVHMLDVNGCGSSKVPNDRCLSIQNDTTVYLDAGAVVVGRMFAEYAHNITIRGRGIMAAVALPGDALPFYAANCSHCGCQGTHALLIQRSQDIYIEGITIMHSTSWIAVMWVTDNVHIKGLKSIGWRCNNDGLDLVSASNVLVEDSFIRSDDDALVLKGDDIDTPTVNIVVKNNLFWNQLYGNCMEIGFELYNAEVRNITFQSNICMHQSGSILSIHDGGRANVHDIMYKDIEALGVLMEPENTSPVYGLKVIDLQIAFGRYSGPDVSQRGYITNVTYMNVSYIPNRVTFLQSRMVGNSSVHAIRDVDFQDFTIAGKKISSLSDLNVTNNSFVYNITFS